MRDDHAIEDMLNNEIICLERVIKAYRKMLLAMNIAPTILDRIEAGARDKKD